MDFQQTDRFANLLFVTSSEALAENIGIAEANNIIGHLKSLDKSFVVDVPKGTAVDQAANQVKTYLGPSIKGVVIIGGYDVVPPCVLDVLTLEQRDAMIAEGEEPTNDKDNFTVYSDDIYGDKDDDLYSEFPVSRIPDGRKANVIMQALTAPPFEIGKKFGVRNLARPFAETCFQTVPGHEEKMNVTEHFRPDHLTAEMGQGAVYYMLHGKDEDNSIYLGETGQRLTLESIRVDKLSDNLKGTVVFAACCWGALTALPTAMNKSSMTSFRPRTVEQSIPLTYLERGANAFIGCTGSHYSPDAPPFNYYGRPMHDYFWAEISAGKPAALALFNAKKKYVTGIPHGADVASVKAIELKMFRIFTCLGLGW